MHSYLPLDLQLLCTQHCSLMYMYESTSSKQIPVHFLCHQWLKNLNHPCIITDLQLVLLLLGTKTPHSGYKSGKHGLCESETDQAVSGLYKAMEIAPKMYFM